MNVFNFFTFFCFFSEVIDFKRIEYTYNFIYYFLFIN